MYPNRTKIQRSTTNVEVLVGVNANVIPPPH